MAVSVRWQHCIDHADKYSKPGRLTRLSSRRSSAADRQSFEGNSTVTELQFTIFFGLKWLYFPIQHVSRKET